MKEPMPPPVLMLAVTPKTKSDQDKLVAGLRQLMAEDPTLRLRDGWETGQAVIAGVGELQLHIVCERLTREFGVQARTAEPQVIYKQAPASESGALLEPIMRVEVTLPKEPRVVGGVVGDLIGRRATIQAQEVRGDTMVFHARVPLATMLGYGAALRARTQGRATFTLKLDSYEPIGGGPDGNDDRISYVGWPVTPRRPLNSSAVALPEPD